jgi:hypothetical protein
LVCEQRVTLLVLAAIVIAGMVEQAVQGGHVYFGAIGVSRGLMPPMFATAIIADFASQWICHEKHHGLAQTFASRPAASMPDYCH